MLTTMAKPMGGEVLSSKLKNSEEQEALIISGCSPWGITRTKGMSEEGLLRAGESSDSSKAGTTSIIRVSVPSSVGGRLWG